MTKIRKALSLIISLLILESLTVPVLATSFEVTRITNVQHPSQVPKGTYCTVKVTCEYTDQVMADIAIINANNTQVIQAITLISQPVGPGNVTFLFNLTTPQDRTIWKLAATTRAWWADSWFSDPAQSIKYFEIDIVDRDSIPVTLESATGFEIDNTQFTDTKSVRLYVTPGTHILRVKPVMQVQPGTRLVFNQWSDKLRSTSRILTVTGEFSLSAEYRTEHELTIQYENGAVTGDGWYETNTIAQIAAPPSLPMTGILGFLGFNAVFQRWDGSLNSSSMIEYIRMNEPRGIRAIWETRWNPEPASLMHLATIGFFGAGLILLPRPPRLRFSSVRKKRPSKKIIFATLVLLTIIPFTELTNQVQANGAEYVVTGADTWRRWGNPYGSTCLIWVGGGIIGQGIRVNPYWLESYNTMRYVQDLAEHYTVFTLERGNDRVNQVDLKRSILTQLYPSQSLQKLRKWAYSNGYRFVFLLGYSVGGIAALEEVTNNDPYGWSTPNGLILVTAPVAESSIEATKIRTNLMLLYGEKMTDLYTQSGKQFYNQVRNDGILDDAWFHKEMHVLRHVSHEVWTRADTGEYNPYASFLTVSFIEKCKTLQRTRQAEVIKKALEPDHDIRQVEVHGPSTITTNSLFRIEIITDSIETENRIELATYDLSRHELISTDTVMLIQGTKKSYTTVYSTTNQTKMKLAVLLMKERIEDDTFQVLGVGILEVRVTDQATLTVLTSNAARLRLDDTTLEPDHSGKVTITTTIGAHVLQVSEILTLTPDTIDIFHSWSDGEKTSRRTLTIRENKTLSVVFRRLFLVRAISQFGTAYGTGWYDANSTAVLSANPVMVYISGSTDLVWYILERWDKGRLDGARAVVIVSAPRDFYANWRSFGETNRFDLSILMLSSSICFFAVSLFFRITRKKSRQVETNHYFE